MSDTGCVIQTAWKSHFAVPAFNIPYLPMMRAVVDAVVAADSFALIDVARLEWVKFEARGVRQIREEYLRCIEHGDGRAHTRLHLDHIPVIDEDNQRVDYLEIIDEALEVGFESVMLDGSRLPFEENVAATKAVTDRAHAAGVPVEAELGAVLGHEAGPLPPYEELFASGRGFTDVEEARRFVAETGVDWLSVAFGNIHGAISAAERRKEKQPAKLDIDHLVSLTEATEVPIVLHGGSGIPQSYVDAAIEHGVAKINIASDIRRAYESALEHDSESGYDAAYRATREAIERLGIEGTAGTIATALEEAGR